MPEGHVLHRLTARLLDDFGGRPVRATSPQGVFAAGAGLLDGRAPRTSDTHGKHLLLGFENEQWLHVHLGLYGRFGFGQPPAPAPTGALRLRLANDHAYADLRGPARCEVLSVFGKDALRARLGADPLRADADPGQPRAALSRSRAPIGILLMDQSVVSGVGNIYRAEVLFRHGIDPRRPGNAITDAEWNAIWSDLVTLMAEGVKTGRIDTVRPEHTPQAMGRAARRDRHGGEVYVYRRAGLGCLVCGALVSTAKVAGRNLFWCPTCQKP